MARKNYTIPKDTWTDINTLSGIAAGTEMIIQNTSIFPCLVNAFSVTPASHENDYAILPSLQTYIMKETDKIYVRFEHHDGIVSVEVNA